jgi:uncharacterized sulfatase
MSDRQPPDGGAAGGRPAWRWLVVLLALAANGARGEPPRRPHVIHILVDDLGWADLSCFGATGGRTPHIDRLAREGIRFGQFYVNAPVCSPSRVALTTGQYPQRWRITSYLDNRAANERRGMAQWLDPAAPSLARMLRDRGYATGHFGKWHMGGQRDVADAPPITAYGFDASLTNFEGMGAKLLPLTLRPGATEPGRIWADAERLGGPVRWMQRAEITGGFVAAARDFLDAAVAAERPSFINLWPDDVHSPFWPPVDRWREDKRGMYLAVLEEMDRQLGTLFDHIRASPALRESTLVILCSDNGPEPGAGSAGPLRGAKTTLHEGGIRAPLVVWGPGFVAADRAGSRDDTTVLAGFDLPPTLLAIAGATPPAGVVFDGEALVAPLLGRGPATRTAPLCWRRPPDRKRWPQQGLAEQPDLAIRQGKWKLLCDYDGSSARLHDLDSDPGETVDLTRREPDLVDRLRTAVVTWHRSLPADSGAALAAAAEPGAAPGRE